MDAFREVVLHGPRQAGKTTLARLIAERRGAVYRTMDDDAERAAATANPAGYLDIIEAPQLIE